MRPVLTLDIECYVNYFLAKFTRVDTRAVREYELFEDSLGIASDGPQFKVKEIVSILRNYTVVTFNGNGYDIPMLCYALTGASPAMLKAASDAIIVGNLRSWEFEEHFEVRIPSFIDHIDLIEVAPGQASLKLYGGRLHSRKLQDLPIEPNARITHEQRSLMREYCGNDHDTTIDLLNSLKPQLALREQMSVDYGQDLRSKSDAQIAEAVIKSQIAKITGSVPRRPAIPAGTSFKYTPPAFITFKLPRLRAKLAAIRDASFILDQNGSVVMPPELDDAKIAIGNSVYRMGIGGLHSSEESTYHLSDSETVLIDRDVASYYPYIILNNRLAPKHLGENFLKVYKDIVDRRIAAKRAGHKTTADSLKITINGSFGKLGSKWSALYSPDLMIGVTVTGQLALLMLIESIEGAGIPVVSGNTDGIVIKCPRARENDLLALVSQWEAVTGFETEETRYSALFSRDVNNYLAVKEKGGEVKTKGEFAAPSLQKNPCNVICTEAAAAFLSKGTPLAETIFACKDVRKFLTVRTVKGGGVIPDHYEWFDDWVQVAPREWMRQAWLDDLSTMRKKPVERVSRPHPVREYTKSTYLGKVVRWYYSTEKRGEEASTIHYASNGNKVPRSEGCKPLMVLPETLPDDIDYEWYLTEANDIIKRVGVNLA